jgi:tellurite resistance protein TehA-like permease
MLDLVCRITTIVFAILYLLALIAFMTGTFGWLGQEKDPLSGVFLLPLGLPWILLADLLSESTKPWFAALAPVFNLLALVLICKWVRSLRQ